MTPIYAGIDLASSTLKASPNFASYPRKVINLVTDGAPNVGSPTPTQAAVNSRNNLLSNLGMTSDEDEFDAEFVGAGDISWLRDSIVWPQPGYTDWPPTGPGWIRQVSSYTEFSETICEKFILIIGGMYVPRFVFEFDASDGTGLFINGEEGQPPTADAGGPYYGDCSEAIPLDGSGSYDNDEGGSSIVQYDWKFYSGDTWHNDIGSNPMNMYGSTGTYTVTLRVHDDEGATDTDTTTVHITTCEGDDDDDDDDDDVTSAVIIMEDVEPCEEQTDYGYLKAMNIAENIGSCEVTLLYDPSVVSILGVDDGEFETMVHYDDGAGTLSITAFNTVVELTGDFNIARIEFGAAGDTCDISLLEIDESELFTADVSPDSVPHSRDHGYASICPDDPECDGNGDCDGDMDGNGNTNSADVRHLALYIAGDPAYTPLCPVC